MLAHELHGGAISFVEGSDLPGVVPLRHKRLVRRLRRDLRASAPLLLLGTLALLLAVTVTALERGVRLEPVYFATISSNSTSNVSAAPGGIVGGAPRSP